MFFALSEHINNLHNSPLKWILHNAVFFTDGKLIESILKVAQWQSGEKSVSYENMYLHILTRILVCLFNSFS